MLVETVLSMLTTVCRLKKVAHRKWDAFNSRLAYMMGAFNFLVKWKGWKADEEGFFPLSIAEFGL